MIHLATSDLLISPPNIQDSRFKESVIMLTHHTRGGSFGLCVNKLSHYRVSDLTEMSEMAFDLELDFPLFWGGPVNPGTIWMLHSSEWEHSNTIPIDRQWSMTSHESMFHHIADGDTPEYFRFMYGYCGWSKNQLMGELEGNHPWHHSHSWLTARNPGPDWLLEWDYDILWEQCTELSGQQAVSSWLN